MQPQLKFQVSVEFSEVEVSEPSLVNEIEHSMIFSAKVEEHVFQRVLMVFGVAKLHKSGNHEGGEGRDRLVGKLQKLGFTRIFLIQFHPIQINQLLVDVFGGVIARDEDFGIGEAFATDDELGVHGLFSC